MAHKPIKNKRRPFIILAIAIGALLSFFILRGAYVYASIPIYKWYWQQNLDRPVQKNDVVVVALGDSTVQGLGAILPQKGFVGKVTKRMDQSKDISIYNYSRSGAKSAEVLDNQVPQALKLDRIDAVIIAVGPNDITHKISLEQFIDNYKNIVKQFPSDKIVVATLPPMGPRDIDGQSSYDWGLQVKELARTSDIRIAPVFDRVNARVNDPRIYAGDFYHPSTAGYTLWADAFEAPLQVILNQ